MVIDICHVLIICEYFIWCLRLIVLESDYILAVVKYNYFVCWNFINFIYWKITGSSFRNNLMCKKQGKAAYNTPNWWDPFSDPTCGSFTAVGSYKLNK